MNTFTPGPWTAVKAAGSRTWLVNSKTWNELASVYGNQDRGLNSEGEANARLVAAAPDLLSAARQAREFFEKNMGLLFGPDHDIPMAAGASLAIQYLDAAIAKAFGK